MEEESKPSGEEGTSLWNRIFGVLSKDSAREAAKTIGQEIPDLYFTRQGKLRRLTQDFKPHGVPNASPLPPELLEALKEVEGGGKLVSKGKSALPEAMMPRFKGKETSTGQFLGEASASPGQVVQTPGQASASPGQVVQTPGQVAQIPGEASASPSQETQTLGEADSSPADSTILKGKDQNDQVGEAGEAENQLVEEEESDRDSSPTGTPTENKQESEPEVKAPDNIAKTTDDKKGEGDKEKEDPNQIVSVPNRYAIAYSIIMQRVTDEPALNKGYIIYAQDDLTSVGRWCKWNNDLHFWETMTEEAVEGLLGRYLAKCPAPRKHLQTMTAMQEPTRVRQLMQFIENARRYGFPAGSASRIAFKNGSLNLSTMRLHSRFPPFDPSDQRYSINRPKALIGVGANYTSKLPPWEVLDFLFFLCSYDPLRVNLLRYELRRIFLNDLTTQQILYLIGASNSGKSTLLDWLNKIFGALVIIMKFYNLTSNFHMLRCAIARLIIFDEVIAGRPAELENFRQFATQGVMVGERKFGSISNMRVSANVVVAGNVQSIINYTNCKYNLFIRVSKNVVIVYKSINFLCYYKS